MYVCDSAGGRGVLSHCLEYVVRVGNTEPLPCVCGGDS